MESGELGSARQGDSLADLWPLRRDVAYLNHGSFGATPTSVLQFQQVLQHELEQQPMDFLAHELRGRLARVRELLGPFVGAVPDDLALVTNATTGANAVVRSLDFEPGDELLTTTHAYGAVRKTLEYVAARSGARVVAAEIAFPLEHDEQVVQGILKEVTPRTRLAVIDHVTSPTALVFPIARIVQELRERGVETLVDGAHALGMVPLRLDELGAAYYTTNAHKWLCAPKSAGFLHVRRDLQRRIHPTTISHGYDPSLRGEARFREEFDWVGTVDPTPWLTIPECLRYVGGLVAGGWDEVMARNRELALEARRIVCCALAVDVPCSDTMIGSIASIPLPAVRAESAADRMNHEELMQWFRERGVQTWLYPWACVGRKLIRVSAQLYNRKEEFAHLAGLLREAIGLD